MSAAYWINQNQTYSPTVPYDTPSGFYQGTGSGLTQPNQSQTSVYLHYGSSNTTDHYWRTEEQRREEQRAMAMRATDDFLASIEREPPPPPEPAAAKARHGYQMAPRKPGYRSPRTR